MINIICNIENKIISFFLGLPTLLLQKQSGGNGVPEHFFRVFLVVSLVTIAGCNASTPKKEEQKDDVTAKIYESSKRISSALDRISRVAYHESDVPPAHMTRWKGALATPISLYWPGALEKGVREVAGQIGYRVKVKGTPPAVPKTVIINAKDVPAGDVLESMGWQAGRNIGVVVDEVLKVVQIVYVGKGY